MTEEMSVRERATEVEIWSRTIRPDIGDMSPLAAREFLGWRLDDADAERIRQLSEKANEGTLSEGESAELDLYLSVARALEFLKSKARLSLRNATAPS